MMLGTLATDGAYDPKPNHLRALEHQLIEVHKKRSTRVMFNMPPRMGKSELSSHYFPAWRFGHNPEEDTMIISHTQSLAQDFGGKARDTLTQFGPALWNVRVSQQTKAKDLWRLRNHKGTFMSLGVGGRPLGRGGHVILIDDPYGNEEDALSETVREGVSGWWRGTIRNRLEPGGAIIIVMQRWHTEDLCGELQNERPDLWDVIRMPAIAEEDETWPLSNGDVWHRKEGESIWPERWPVEMLQDIQKDVGPYFWAAQYMQRPIPLGGAMFQEDWLRFYASDGWYHKLMQPDGSLRLVDVRHCQRIVTMDIAVTEAETADYTCIQVWDISPEGDLILIDQQRFQLSGPEIKRRVPEINERYWPAAIYPEYAGVGIPIIQDLTEMGLPISAVKPGNKSKTLRALGAQARMAAGKIYFDKSAAYWPELRREVLSFPASKHKDQVDTMAYAAMIAHEGYGVGGWSAKLRR